MLLVSCYQQTPTYCIYTPLSTVTHRRALADDLDIISRVEDAEKHMTSLGRDVVSWC